MFCPYTPRMRRLVSVLLASALILPTAAPAIAAAPAKPGAACTKVGAKAKAGSVKLVCKKSGKKLLWAKVVVKPSTTPPTTPETPGNSGGGTSLAPSDLPKPGNDVNAALWLRNPLTGKALTTGIYMRSATSDWKFTPANSDGTLLLKLADGSYDVDVVEPNATLKRKTYYLSVSGGVLTVDFLTKDVSGYWVLSPDLPYQPIKIKSADPTFTLLATPENLKALPQEAQKAVTEVLSLYATLPTSTPPALTFVVETNVPQATVDFVRSGINSGARLFDAFLESPIEMYVVLGGTRDWSIKQIVDLQQKRGANKTSFETWFTNNLWRDTGGSAFQDQRAGGSLVNLGFYNVPPVFVAGSRASDCQTPPHEYTHAAQAELINANTGKLPVWFTEGYAAFIGGVMCQASGIGTYAGDRGMVANKEYVRGRSIRDYAGSEFKDGVYAVGMLASELLISKYGFVKTIRFMESIRATGDWRKSFEQTFGTTIDAFYTEADTYITAHANS